MKIIDIHVHVFPEISGITQGQPLSSTTLGRAKIGNKETQFLLPEFENSNSPVDVYLRYMNWLGIDKAILMANPYYGYHNDYFSESIKKYPNKFKGVALVDPLKGELAAEELAAIYEDGTLFGFKIEVNSTFQCNPQGKLKDAIFDPVWNCINQYKQPVFIHALRDCDLADVNKLSKQYKNIDFIMCHMGADACFTDHVNSGNYAELLKLVKETNNVYLDTSSVPFYFDEEYPFPTSVEIIEKAYKVVGAEKIMWSSDYPGMCNFATLKQLINLVKLQCKNISEQDKELIMGKNAEKLFFSNK